MSTPKQRPFAFIVALWLTALSPGMHAPTTFAGSSPRWSVATVGDPSPGSSADSDGDGLDDAFEVTYGLNPRDADSNHNGVLDPAEDPDRDDLGNLGEQRFGTSPSDPDTDHDGISDWNEDGDEDGIPDGSEQDHRRVPAHLKPSLANALYDTPVSYGDGCLSNVHDSTVHPCLYGDKSGTTEVAILGDSHAAQWLPALVAIGNHEHWRIRSVTKSGCPALRAHFASNSYASSDSCRTWRKHAVEWLDGHPPDLIIVSDFRGYPIAGPDGRHLRGTERQAAWGAGLTRLLGALPAGSLLMVLADTPRMRLDPVKCLEHHPANIAACETARIDAGDLAHNAAEQAAAARSGAAFRSMGHQICPYDPCPVIVGRYVIWREDSHLTATYSRKLAPSLRIMVRAVLG
jgi:SGNH domain (fused to AT3 domains)